MATRRSHLALLLVGSLLVAGCSGSVLVETVAHHVQVLNDDDVPHELRVVVESREDSVLNRTVIVQPGESQLVTSITEAGEYRVAATTANGSRLEHSYSLPVVEGDRRSYFEVSVEEGGNLEKMLYWQR